MSSVRSICAGLSLTTILFTLKSMLSTTTLDSHSACPPDKLFEHALT